MGGRKGRLPDERFHPGNDRRPAMKYSQVYLDAIGYELPPVVVTSQELEARLQPVYQALRFPEGQLEALTGIHERRWWEPGFPVSQGATLAARKALERS